MKQELIQMFKEISLLISKRSTCCRKQVGSLIIRDGRIISTGWNGNFSKQTHCSDYFKFKIQTENLNPEIYYKSKEFYEEHGKFSELKEVHSELNAILHSKQDLSNTQLFCTLSPCLNCSKAIIASGITELYYIEDYDRDPLSGINLLKENNIKVFKI